MEEFDTIILKVNNCLNPVYGVVGVTVDQDRRNRIDYFVDTNTVPTRFLNFIRIYRSEDSGSTYNLVNTGNPLLGYAFDGSPGQNGVDNQYYYYAIDLIANGYAVGQTRALHTINLQADLTNLANVPVSWSSYAGVNYSDFANLQYQLQFGEENDTGGYDWQDVTTGFPTSDSTATFSAVGQDPGNYALRVITLTDANGYSSESNWVIYGVPVDPIIPDPEAPPLTVPDVFTPNGDGLNDRWTIDGIENWNSRKVAIFDRWGRKVWSSDKYTNDNPF
ncbi:T9SS type B sorting domain-containing protein, partial [Phaeocystidibacter marisrubri]